MYSKYLSIFISNHRKVTLVLSKSEIVGLVIYMSNIRYIYTASEKLTFRLVATISILFSNFSLDNIVYWNLRLVVNCMLLNVCTTKLGKLVYSEKSLFCLL